MTAVFQLLACALTLASAIPTAMATAQRVASPRTATWFMLVVFNAVFSVVALDQGKQATAVFGLATFTGTLLVLILVLMKKPRPYGAADAACQCLASLALALVLSATDPQQTVAIILVTAAGLLTAAPTVYYELRSQSSELWFTHLGYAAAAGIMLAVTDSANFLAITMPLFMLVSGSATAALLLLIKLVRARAARKLMAS